MASANRPRRIVFDVPRLVRATEEGRRKALNEFAAYLTNGLRGRISRPGPPRSKPGTYPHVDSGELHSTTEFQRVADQVRLRTLQYGLYLQSGTINMARRKFYLDYLFGAPGSGRLRDSHRTKLLSLLRKHSAASLRKARVSR